MPRPTPAKDRPLTVAIPLPYSTSSSVSHHMKRPTLHEILAGRSQAPWTLTAFTAYLSQNHCLETLEFTLDAQRYREHYNKAISTSTANQLVPFTEDSTNILGYWHRIIQAYIQQNGVREVNLPSAVRDALLRQDLSTVPPHPDTLNPAVDKVHELMEDSVLVPFLNSLYHHPVSRPESSVEDLTSISFDESNFAKSRRRRSPPKSHSPPPGSASPGAGNSPRHSSELNRSSGLNAFGRNITQSVRHGFRSHSPASSRPVSTLSQNPKALATSAHSPVLCGPGLGPGSGPEEPHMLNRRTATDESLSRPMTPPHTPPIGDSILSSASPTNKQNPWKRMRYSFGFKRKTEEI